MVNCIKEKSIIILKQWKLVDKAALHTIKQCDIVNNDLYLVWKLLSNEHYPLSNYNDKLAHYDTFDPVPTAKLENPLF